MTRDDEFAAYYRSRAAAVRNVAFLLCGNWHTAEDLTQNAFVKLYRVWPRVSQSGSLERYVHQVLVRSYVDERRRPWRRESPTEPYSTALDRTMPESTTDERLLLLAALDRVPPRQRAALVLRFWLDLPVTEVAELLGCAEGTVKSQTTRGLATLRAHIGIATGGRP